MDPATRAVLHQAYDLIKAGDKDAARTLIKPVLGAEKDNIDAWWLAAHAAVSPHDKRLALVQVLRLNPRHHPARLMLDRLNKQNPQEVDELAKDLPLPPPGQKRRDTVQTVRQHRWVWNVILAFGCLSFSFASAALISGLMGLTWLDDTADSIGEALGVGHRQDADGQWGTVPGGDPARPYDVPVTRKMGAVVGNTPMVGALQEDEAHIFTFHAQRGQEVTALLQFTVAGDARYVMELWDSGQNRLATGAGDDNSATVTLVYELTRTGQYALVIIGRPGGPHGDYALGVNVIG